jgi:hypothetical protein
MGLSVEQAQKQTHISARVISAMEDGQCDTMLTANYVKSFLKEYSKFLGFDHQKVVDEYLSLHPELQVKGINTGISGLDEKRTAKLSAIIRMSGWAALALLVISLAVFGISKAGSLFKRSGDARGARTVKDRKAVSAPKARSVKAPVTKTAAAVAAPKAASVKNGPFTMVLRVKNPVMVQLKKDGALIFKRVLPKGIEETFSVNNSINMFVGRAEAIEIIINGRSFGSPGRGVIRNIEVTSNGVKTR